MVANTQRGLQRVVSELGVKAEVDTSAVSPSIPDPGWDKVGEAGAKVFSAIGDKLGRWADKAAAIEGEQQGELDALNPEFRPRNDMTIRGQSYDRAGLEIWERRVSMQIGKDVEAAKAAAGGDTLVLQDVLTKQQKAIVASLPPQARARAQLKFENEHFTAMREAARQRQAETIAAHREAVIGDITQRVAGISQKGYSLGLDEKADEVLASEVGELNKLLATKGVDGKPLFTGEQRRKIIKDVQDDALKARMLGAFNRIPTLEGKQQFLKDFEKDFEEGGPVGGKFDIDGMLRMRGTLEGEYQRASTEQRAAANQLEHEVKSFASMAEKGFALPPDQMAGLKSRVARLGTAEQQTAFLEAADLHEWMAGARRLAPQQLEAYVEQQRIRMREGGTGPREIRRLEATERLLTEMRAGVKKDQLGWGQEALGIEVNPLDFSSGEALASSLKARAGITKALQDRYGGDRQFFRPDERQMLGRLAAEGGQKLIQVSQAVVQALGTDAPAALGEVAKEAPEAAIAGKLMLEGGDPLIIQEIALGVGLKLMAGYKPRITGDQDVMVAFNQVVGRAFEAMPQAGDLYIKAAKAAYETQAHRYNLATFEPERFKSILNRVLGQTDVGGIKYGGVGEQRSGVNRVTFGFLGSQTNVVVPQNVRSDSFGDLLDTVRWQRDKAVLGEAKAADGSNLTWSTLRQGRWVNVGGSKYAVDTGSDAEFPLWAVDAKGQRKVFDLAPLMPELQRRNPRIFLGAQ